MFYTTKRCPILDKRWGSENDFAKQKVMWSREASHLENKITNRQSGSSNSIIQQFISTILTAVTNLQGQSSGNNEQGSSPQQYSNVQDEVSAQLTSHTERSAKRKFRAKKPQWTWGPFWIGSAVRLQSPSKLQRSPAIRRHVRGLRGMGNLRSRGSSCSSSYTAFEPFNFEWRHYGVTWESIAMLVQTL